MELNPAVRGDSDITGLQKRREAGLLFFILLLQAEDRRGEADCKKRMQRAGLTGEGCKASRGRCGIFIEIGRKTVYDIRGGAYS